MSEHITEVQPVGQSVPEHDQHKVARAAVAGVVALGSLVGVGQTAEIEHATEVSPPVVHETVQNTTVTIQEQLDSDVLNDWARTFATSPEDSAESFEQVDRFIEDHLDVFLHPEKITSVKVTGLASAEGDTQGADLAEANPKNEQLAAQRAELAKGALIERVKQRFGYDLNEKTTVSAIEDSLTPAEITQIDELASKYKFESHTEMIKLYNRGKLTKNSEITEILDTLLKKERGALIEIEADEVHDVTVPGWYVESGQSDPAPKEKEMTSRYEEKGYIPEESQLQEESDTPEPEDSYDTHEPQLIKKSNRVKSGIMKRAEVNPPEEIHTDIGHVTKDSEYTQKVTDPSQVRKQTAAYNHKQPLPHNYFSATSRPARRTERSGHKSVSRNRQGRRG